MKKLKIMGVAAISLALLASCGGKNEGKDIKNLKYDNPTDSLSYYLGEMQGLGYYEVVEMDTLLKGEDAKEAYIKGLEKGIAMGDQEKAYLLGLVQGISLSLEKDNFKEQADFAINKDAFSNGLRFAMNNDSIARSHNPQEKGEALHVEMVKKKLDKVMTEAAKKKGMKKISEGVYGGKAKGETVKPDDTVLVSIETLDDKGKIMDVVASEQVAPLPQMPEGFPVKDMILATPMNGSNTFMMSAYDFYNVFAYGRIPPNVKPSEIINVKVSVAPAADIVMDMPMNTPAL